MKLYLKKQLSAAAFLYAGCIAVGYSAGWTAPILPKLQNPDQSPIPLVTDGEASWVASVAFIGALMCANIGGYLSNIKGRKPCLQLGAIFFMISFLTLALSVNLTMILVGRVFTGMGVAFLYVHFMVYFAEIASTNIRGILLSATAVFGVLGTLLVYSVGPYVSYAATCYIGFFISVVFFFGTIIVPETPVFYLLKGNESEAKRVLIQLGRVNDIEEIFDTKLVSGHTARKQEWLELFNKSNRKALFLILVLIFLQQASGAQSVILFSTNIFRSVNSSLDPSVSTIIMGLTQLVASLIAPIFIDRSGRKSLLMISTSACSVSMAFLGVYFYLEYVGNSASNQISWLPITSLVSFLLSYNTGLAIVPEAYMGEVFESNVRGPGSALAITLGWLVSFAATTCFGYITSALGGHVMFWMNSCVCAVAFIFTVIFVPETKGKSLVEIQYMLRK